MNDKKKGLAPVVPISSAAAPAQAPKPPVVLALSEADRWFVAQILHVVPWTGGEAVILALNNIHATLVLSKIDLAKMYAKCTTNTKKYTLPSGEVELLIGALCNTGVKGAAGPSFAKLVVRLREMVKHAK